MLKWDRVLSLCPALALLRRVDMNVFNAVNVNDIGDDAMPRTGVILRRIHVFVELQGEYCDIRNQWTLSWPLVVAYTNGLVTEEGITEEGWDKVELLFEFLYEYSAWEDFRLTEEL
jgi:hypothetical protein